ncbi:MAG: hypothetical protein VKL39_24245 [Leptolyngbyaceae bacterium]|nr:hypothetical protein [Leptolyngbyaceae bacterium]
MIGDIIFTCLLVLVVVSTIWDAIEKRRLSKEIKVLIHDGDKPMLPQKAMKKQIEKPEQIKRGGVVHLTDRHELNLENGWDQ